MKKIILLLTIAFIGLISCDKSSETTTPTDKQKDTTGNGGTGNPETGINLNPEFTFNFNGQKIEFSKIEANYGAKTYMIGFDKAQRFVLDITLPMAKNITANAKKFTIVSDQYTGMGLFIDNQDKSWYFEGGNINITRNVNNKVSGTFNCKALLLDYTGTVPVRMDSVDVTSGVFNNIGVKD